MVWRGMFGTVVCTAVGTPVLLAALRNDGATLVPGSLWAVCFAAFLAALVTCTWLTHLLSRRTVLGVFAAQVALGAALVLAAPTAGWLPILLVFTSALSAFLVGTRTIGMIIVLNTLVVAAAARVVTDEPAGIALTALIYAGLQLGSTFSELAQLREAAMRAELAVANTELRAAGALLAQSSRAEERLRIARELHDLIGHQLTALALELEVAAHRSVPPASEHVGRARRITRELLTDVRAAVGELRRRAPELRETLNRIVADLPAPDIRLNIDADVQTDEERTAAIIRCVQEIITNTIRHADASVLRIDITADPGGGLVLTASDDGTGAGRVVAGNGLRGISERVEALGGRVRFWADGGFHLSASVPAP
ncbi:hypothetical protein GCM10010517_29390 [Streptosporangium fragile]|uniref:Signal transduction histidine kinase subgroup 3 dimerisation and phosphoacceptor domain-containing protein n=1 Tax=Streptosporangium fragile TaxID=46186 RepID=A0ABN3VZ47_9ACTN